MDVSGSGRADPRRDPPSRVSTEGTTPGGRLRRGTGAMREAGAPSGTDVRRTAARHLAEQSTVQTSEIRQGLAAEAQPPDLARLLHHFLLLPLALWNKRTVGLNYGSAIQGRDRTCGHSSLSGALRQAGKSTVAAGSRRGRGGRVGSRRNCQPKGEEGGAGEAILLRPPFGEPRSPTTRPY